MGFAPWPFFEHHFSHVLAAPNEPKKKYFSHPTAVFISYYSFFTAQQPTKKKQLRKKDFILKTN